jgi:hypothetical protein
VDQHVTGKNDDRPVWFSVWGGVNVLAQAVWKIKQTRSPEQASKLYKKSGFIPFQIRMMQVRGYGKHSLPFSTYAVRDILTCDLAWNVF